ncbi:MAG: BON domain-containing protein [Blastocatellia bacterium]
MRILLIVLAALVMLASASCERRDVADSAITTKVKSKLALDTETSALKIDVDTNSGVVTLTGATQTQAEKSEAERIARDTEGVTRVVNNITVAPGGIGVGEKAEEDVKGAGVTASDLIIQSKIKTRYVAEGIMGASVDVKGGIVTLTGSVRNTQDKARAENIARATSGVKNVSNLVEVRE